jgi:phosphatidate cytidylyltransferase
MLGKRIITAVLGIIATIFIVNYGQWIFAVTALLITALAWHEFYNMMVRREIEISYILGLIAIILLWGTAWLGNSQETIAVLLFAVFIILAKTIIAHSKFTIRDAVYTIAGLIYIGLPFSHLTLLRFTDSSILLTKFGTISTGAAYLWIALVGTWATDTFAFFTGTYLGKHKLAPSISPGKTWEGTIGGLIGSVVAIAILGSFLKISLINSIFIGLLIGVVAPIGDLVESAIKRFAGVKDSGRLLPGHGGVLDRFDSIMLTVPTVYYYVYAFFIK